MLKISVKDKELNMEVAGDIKTITKEFCVAAKSLKEKLDSSDKLAGLIFGHALVGVMLDSDGDDMGDITEKMVRKALNSDDE